MILCFLSNFIHKLLMPALVADTIPRQYILQKLIDKKSKKNNTVP